MKSAAFALEGPGWVMDEAAALASGPAITFSLLRPACSFPGWLLPSLPHLLRVSTHVAFSDAFRDHAIDTAHAPDPGTPILLQDRLFLPRISHHLTHCFSNLFTVSISPPRRLCEGRTFNVLFTAVSQGLKTVLSTRRRPREGLREGGVLLWTRWSDKASLRG